MGAAPSVSCFWVVLWLSSLCRGASYHGFQEAQGLRRHAYSRFSEVQRECTSVLSSPSLVSLDDSVAENIPREMDLHGEWAQDSNHAPLMPMDMGPHGNASGVPRTMFLAYFRVVVDVDEVARSQTAINMSGTLTLSIFEYENWLKGDFPSNLEIAFEGVYSESDEAGGESLMCLLGTAELPSRGDEPADPSKLKNDSYTREARIPLLKDDKIILVVRPPKSLSLT